MCAGLSCQGGVGEVSRPRVSAEGGDDTKIRVTRLQFPQLLEISLKSGPVVGGAVDTWASGGAAERHLVIGPRVAAEAFNGRAGDGRIWRDIDECVVDLVEAAGVTVCDHAGYGEAAVDRPLCVIRGADEAVAARFVGGRA